MGTSRRHAWKVGSRLAAGLLALVFGTGAAFCDHHVGDATALEALDGDALSGGDRICLTADVILSSTYVVDFDFDVRIDGGGLYTLSGDNLNAPLVQFDNVGHIENLRMANDRSGQLVHMLGNGSVTNLHACGLSISNMRSAVQIEGVATVSHVVFEGTGGDGVVFELGSGTVDHVTVLGEAAGSIVGGGGYVTNSLVEPPVGGGWTVDAATITTVNKGLLYAQPDWLCPVDGRPAPGGLAWSSTGEHLGGYTGTAGGPGSQPFAGWADEDGDDFGYGLAGTGFDCDDTLSDVNPGADEVCDNVDNDCDGAIDLDLDSGDVGRVDGDGDGWVSETLCFLCPGVALDCLPASKELDCDDSDPLVPLEEDCPPDDTGTLPGDDDDDVTDPGDDDDDAPGDDDDDTTEPRPTADTGRRVAGTATAGCQCGSGGRLLARVLPLVARRR